MDPKTARRCWRTLEPLHAMIYFAPELDERLATAGLRQGRMCYFAGRSAPMGAVGSGVVTATFHNFSPQLVAKHIPRAWSLADPADIVALRFDAADLALRRLLGDETVASAEVTEAAELAREAAEGCDPQGRPLSAAHADLEWPRAPHLVLWHAASLLREFRGDGHIAALHNAGLGGLDALVTHTATGRGFARRFAQATRGWSDEQWSEAAEDLRVRGILDRDGALTEQGAELRRQVEEDTDRLAVAPWAHLGDDGTERLAQLGKQLAQQVTAAGAFPSEAFAAR